MRRGNSAARWKARQRVRAKSIAGPLPDARDVGVRPEVGRVLGFDDGPACCGVDISPGETCPICDKFMLAEVFAPEDERPTAASDFRRTAWLWFTRDIPEDDER